MTTVLSSTDYRLHRIPSQHSHCMMADTRQTASDTSTSQRDSVLNASYVYSASNPEVSHFYNSCNNRNSKAFTVKRFCSETDPSKFRGVVTDGSSTRDWVVRVPYAVEVPVGQDGKSTLYYQRPGPAFGGALYVAYTADRKSQCAVLERN